MESITIYPKNKRQKQLLESLLEEMKIRFEIGKTSDKTLLTEDEFYAKIDKSLNQADCGQRVALSAEEQKELLGL